MVVETEMLSVEAVVDAVVKKVVENVVENVVEIDAEPVSVAEEEL